MFRGDKNYNARYLEYNKEINNSKFNKNNVVNICLLNDFYAVGKLAAANQRNQEIESNDSSS